MLTTKSEVKAVIGIDHDDDDTLIDSLIERASKIIDTYTNRTLEAQDIEEEFDGTGTNDYVLKQYPVNSVSKLSYRSGYIGDITWKEISSKYYTYYEHSGTLRYADKFTIRPKGYKVEYNAGYATIPADLEQACIDLVTHYYNTRTQKGIKSERIGDYSITYGDGLNTIEMLGLNTILDTYRNIRQ